MAWIDKLMDRLTARGTKVVASGHAPADVTPPTGSGELSEELQADYGPDSPAAEPPDGGRRARLRRLAPPGVEISVM